jgi:hypothetical protein
MPTEVLPGRYWTGRRAATAAGLLVAMAAVLGGIAFAVTGQPPPVVPQHDISVPVAAPAAPSAPSVPAASPSPATRQRHARRHTRAAVPVGGSPSEPPAAAPPSVLMGKAAAFPSVLRLGGTSTGRLTITASGGDVSWSVSASDVSLSAWSGTLGAGKSVTVIVTAYAPGGNGWIRIEPGGIRVTVTWTAQTF